MVVFDMPTTIKEEEYVPLSHKSLIAPPAGRSKKVTFGNPPVTVTAMDQYRHTMTNVEMEKCFYTVRQRQESLLEY